MLCLLTPQGWCLWWLEWGGAWEAIGRRGRGNKRQRGRLPQAGRGRGEPGAWGGGRGGRSNIVAGAHQVLAVSLNKKESQQLWGVEAGSHRLLQPAASPH